MSLVAYGSSDESSDEEEVNPAQDETQKIVANATSNSEQKVVEAPTKLERNAENTQNTMSHINLPVPRFPQDSEKFDDFPSAKSDGGNASRIQFGALPKPISAPCAFAYDDVAEDDDIPLFKPKPVVVEKAAKPDRTPVRISVPSLSEFKDVDEELEKSKNRRTASKKGTGLFAILPPPQSETTTKKTNFIPHVLTKTPANPASPAPKKPAALPKVPQKIAEKSPASRPDPKSTKNPLAVLDYDSNSEDDDEGDEKPDFFSLTKPKPAPASIISPATNFFSIPEKVDGKIALSSENITNKMDFDSNKTAFDSNKMAFVSNKTDFDSNKTDFMPKADDSNDSGKTLVSTVMNLPRDEILLKNKAEVGPKLPVPEQEFNVDAEGNVAFDDKAIEYLCGKRGIKRKNQMFDEANIIEINGEDIKPDEREWMVKALTEEPVQRPVSMQGAGPSSQSKKKHQITYLAHQAKAMEVELKNTWSQNKMARKQTQSKYGF